MNLDDKSPYERHDKGGEKEKIEDNEEDNVCDSSSNNDDKGNKVACNDDMISNNVKFGNVISDTKRNAIRISADVADVILLNNNDNEKEKKKIQFKDIVVKVITGAREKNNDDKNNVDREEEYSTFNDIKFNDNDDDNENKKKSKKENTDCLKCLERVFSRLITFLEVLLKIKSKTAI